MWDASETLALPGGETAMATQRQEQVQSSIQEQISDILRREVSDPLIGFVTVTDVEVSPDLRHARIHVSVLGDERAQQDTMRGLQRARGFLRGLLGRRMSLRSTPELSFHYDHTAATAQRVDQIFDRIEAERAASGGADSESDNAPDDEDSPGLADDPDPA